MDDSVIKLNGKITHIIYHNEKNFYTVAKFTINDDLEKNITVTGTMPEPQVDILYDIYGKYVEHPKYGMQFLIESFEKPLPEEEEGIVRYLSGVQFAGIGKKTAEKVVHALGDDCLAQIKENPEVLKMVPGLSEKHIQAIQEGMQQENDGLEELIRFLNVHGIGIRNLVRLNQTYGKEALRKLKENPYKTIEDCDGFGFKTADAIAMSLGFQKDDERRLYAYLVSLVMDMCMENGDSYIRLEALEARFLKAIRGVGDFEELLHEAVMNRSLIQKEDKIYPVSQYDAENYISLFLSQFPYEDIEKPEKEIIQQYLEAMEKDIQINYDPTQIKAIDTLFDSPVTIMTGGPGTGKTTVVRAMVTLFKMMYPSYTVVCAAPTGRAAKRLAELTGSPAATVHSLLQWDLESNLFARNEENPIDADLLIIDEFSMVDNYLFSNLLKASRNIKKICIIGDEDQLPSVGPGCVLRDMIACDKFPVIRLNHIYRQKTGSDVIALAHAINEGDVDLSKYENDVAFFPCSEYEIKKNVLNVVDGAIGKGYSIDDIQVLSPMYSGSAGIDVLNNALQEYFNGAAEDKREMHIGYRTFREGDKILQLKNQPDDNVYNGDIGRLIEIVPAKESEDHKTTLVVDFQGCFVEYQQETWENITLAYCISIHKSQGSEYPIVIMPLAHAHQRMLQKKLIYTAVTRARKALVMLGDKNAFQHGIETIDLHPRNTTLATMINEFFQREEMMEE
jgi:exodeoxyribonuclease V alpha subunit